MRARLAGDGLTSVQRIWATQGLAPHRLRSFKLSNDLKLADEVGDIVGLGVDSIS